MLGNDTHVRAMKKNCKYQEKASAEIRGEFFRPNSQVNFAVDFLVDFFGPFSLEKTGGKNPPKNPRQFSNRNLGVSRPKSTLQGSGLEQISFSWGEFRSLKKIVRPAPPAPQRNHPPSPGISDKNPTPPRPLGLPPSLPPGRTNKKYPKLPPSSTCS